QRVVHGQRRVVGVVDGRVEADDLAVHPQYEHTAAFRLPGGGGIVAVRVDRPDGGLARPAVERSRVGPARRDQHRAERQREQGDRTGTPPPAGRVGDRNRASLLRHDITISSVTGVPAALAPRSTLRALASSQAGLPTGNQQRNRCSGEPAARRGGSSTRHRSWAYGQRGLNLHPAGGSSRSGGRPGITWSRTWFGPATGGTAFMSASV